MVSDSSQKISKNACLSRRYSQGGACRSRRILCEVGVVATLATGHKRLTFSPILGHPIPPYKVLVQEYLYRQRKLLSELAFENGANDELRFELRRSSTKKALVLRDRVAHNLTNARKLSGTAFCRIG